MAHLIDKDALVAEIERLKTIYNEEENIRHVAKYNILVDILSFINTLEVKEIDTEQLNKLLNWWKGVTTDYSAYKVKEVDFEKELDRIWFDNKLGDYFDNDALDFAHIRTLCRHFFELGIKVQKGE